MSRAYMGQRAAAQGKPRRQGGAALLEFALAFPIFFVVVYALLAYGLLFYTQQSMVLAVEEGVRAAVAVDPARYVDPATKNLDFNAYAANVTQRAKQVAQDRLSWLPQVFRQKVTLEVGLGADRLLTVRLRYPDYANDPIVPAIALPGLGKIPPYPQEIKSEARFQL